jgi:hypothetical protein
VNDEFETIWKDAVVVLSPYSHGVTEKNHKKFSIVGLGAVIGLWNRPNTKQEC